jgi:hypothetical protein
MVTKERNTKTTRKVKVSSKATLLSSAASVQTAAAVAQAPPPAVEPRPVRVKTKTNGSGAPAPNGADGEAHSAATLKRDPTAIFNNMGRLRSVKKPIVKKTSVLVDVPIDKPANNVWFRCHPDPEMQLDSAILRDGNTYYYVDLDMHEHPKLAKRIRWVTLALVYSWPGGGIQIWPVPFKGSRKQPAWDSAREAFELSQTHWVQMVYNEETRGYDIDTADRPNQVPVWPNKSFEDYLKIGFGDRIIVDEDHPYMNQLRFIDDE